VRDELVDLELAGHVIVDQVGKLSTALDTTKGAAFPYTAGDELECCIIVSMAFLLCLFVCDGGKTYVVWQSPDQQQRHQ